MYNELSKYNSFIALFQKKEFFKTDLNKYLKDVNVKFQ